MCVVLERLVRFSVVVVLLVERLHVDLCRVNGDLCR
ncbi:putative leader peptide [Microtetraspora malaysiensis]|uniref:Leader peptide n=1 Tax=Microtetraspora malaysiensis TaxID=161358 RepID=A0ABW6SUZ1_9ACTN